MMYLKMLHEMRASKAAAIMKRPSALYVNTGILAAATHGEKAAAWKQ